MTVSSEHPEYEVNNPKWRLVRDVVTSNVKQYIKDVDPSDPYRSIRYRDDAQFTNFSGRTKNALVGAIFRRDPLLDLPDSAEHLLTDATGGCTPLNKLAQEITSEVIQTGRFGLLTDFPVRDPEEAVSEGMNAYISKYPAEAIINWKEENINGRVKLSLVVLKEVSDSIDPEDGFEWRESILYRVLRLVDGVYVQALYNEDEEFLGSYTPLDSLGNTWDSIPFEFVGSEDNNARVDHAPLYDISRLNIGHLRNSADYEESVHITGQPTLFLTTSMSAEEFAESNPAGVQIGARRGHNLGQSGKAEFLQANPNQLADQAMVRKEQQAVMIGAKLITPQATNETAEAARMRHSGETSILSILAKNVESALYKSVMHVLRFMDPDYQSLEKPRIELNDQFFDTNLDPNMIMAQIQLAERGVITTTDMRNTLRKHGVLQDNRTDSDIDQDNSSMSDMEEPDDNN